MNYEQTKELLVSAMQDQNYAADTQKKFKASLAYISSFLNKTTDMEKITPEEIQGFLNHLAFDKDLSPSTVNNYQAALKFIFETVFEKEWSDKFSYYTRPKSKIIPPIPSIPDSAISLQEGILSFIYRMELRGNAAGTQAGYIRAIRKFVAYTKSESNLCCLTLDDVQDFLHHQHYIAKINPETVNLYRTAIKLFFITVLNKEWHELMIPSYKCEKRIPAVLSPPEVINLLNAIQSPVYKMICILMYSAGLRLSEAIKLKISDIDSKNMQILVIDTKTHKDRYALLSHQCLLELRKFYKTYHPSNYLFPSQRYNLYVSKESVQQAVRVAALKAKITKPISTHTLRHCFATHLLENDTNLFYIKELLGHSSLRSTTTYLHTMSFNNINVKSPLDLVGGLK
ncbi:tyrosine-type recombinase/integrase [Cellulosilyticum sp. WCF-2]|uniref:tyrosine-type recombinase/integrase n=1 Tax=Cellulosilyticum sp. WCF-2 TaxID=2497860 RepID=UPI000F8DDA3E|nr:tyrosine-type recombinase/integrase [Cellulosilyticum sp. WCF-2]QEH69048.1 tyrosine-type recombinase/integrase [Cellulosilyticum sp. WCF-2]